MDIGFSQNLWKVLKANISQHVWLQLRHKVCGTL